MEAGGGWSRRDERLGWSCRGTGLRDDAGSQDAVRAAGGGCGRPGAGVGCERPGAGQATSEGAVWRVNEGRGRSLSEIRGTG